VTDDPTVRPPSAGAGTVVRPEGQAGQAVPGAGSLGMTVFLASLSVLFLASLVGYLIVRSRAATWPPEGSAGLPGSLWLSTAVIVAASFAVHAALTGIRRGNPTRLLVGLLATAALGVAFLVLQAFNWLELVSRDVSPGRDLYGFTFYMLTGLHAAHVVGGLIPLGITVVRAFLGKYTWASYGGVRNVATYWHFLDVVWLVLFAVLWFGS